MLSVAQYVSWHQNYRYLKLYFAAQYINNQGKTSMDIQNSLEQLEQEFIELALKETPEVSETVKSNTLVAPPMPWESKPDQIGQFNKMYLDRLAKLSKRIDLPKIRKIQELDEKLKQTVSIVGIFKRIEFQRKRAFQNNYDEYYQNAETIYDERDSLEIEDSSGRVKFIFDEDATFNGKSFIDTDLPYGIIIGLTGYYHDKKHHFVAQSAVLPSLPPQKSIRMIQQATPRKLLIMSEPTVDAVIKSLKEVVEFRIQQVKQHIKAVVIMGLEDGNRPAEIKKLDEFFSYYSKFLDIYLMPGQYVKESFPQKPFHPILFRNSYKSIGRVSNPQYFEVNSSRAAPHIDEDSLMAKMLMFSGQNLKDLKKNCSFGQDDLDTLQSIFEYSHMAPTTPFSLKSWMTPEDFLTIQELPHLAVAGNTKAFLTRDFEAQGKRIRLLTMKAGDMGLVDLDDLSICKFALTNLEYDSSN